MHLRDEGALIGQVEVERRERRARVVDVDGRLLLLRGGGARGGGGLGGGGLRVELLLARACDESGLVWA